MPNVLSSYMQGQQAVENNKRNRLLDMQLQNAPAEQARSNKLADLQLGRQQQAFEATATEQTKAKEVEGIKQGIAGAQYVLQAKSPKAEAEKRYPEFVAQVKQGGLDWDSLDDNAVREMAGGLVNELSAKAGIGPTPKLQTTYGADGQVIQTNPTTGEVKQAIAPREDFRAKADYSDKLQRGRDADAREFTARRDKDQAEVQRELAKIRASSAGEKPTDAQRLSAGFLIRMQDTEPAFEGFTPTTKDYVLYNKILKNEGGFFGSGTAAELNKQLRPEAQEYFQRASDWVRAKLRKESGAVITPQEMLSEITTYFPLPGDSPKNLENKTRSRQVATEAMRIAAGAPGENAAAPPRPEAAIQPQAEPQPKSAGAAGPARVSSEAQYNQLPSGAQYIGPDGQLRQKR